jgi:CubicO group peptidase (beta-lactamase class C family)
MKSLRQIATALVLLIIAHSCMRAQKKQPSYSKEVEEKIRQVENNLGGWVRIADTTIHFSLADRMAYYKIKGLTIAVVHHYQLEWARGYGWADSAEKRPVTEQTLFQAASISKSLNGVGVLKLVEDGKLNLTDDINNYLKSWKFPADNLTGNKKISVANLLSHTAGLGVHGFGGYGVGVPIPTTIQVLNGEKPSNSKPVRSEFAPGLRSEYSGGGITISQLIVTDITGEAYDKYQAENILQPMGMISSFYTQPPPADKAPLLASAYHNDGSPIEGKFHIYPEMAAAGLWTNPTDLCKYIIETQLSLEGKSNKVLSQNMTRTRLTPFIDSNAALGVFIEKRGDRYYFGHGGANEGFRCQYLGSMQDGDGVAVMVNSDNGQILNEIINSVSTTYDWPGYYKPVLKKIVQVPFDILDTYIGKYVMDNITLSIFNKQGGLYLSQNGNPAVPLYFASKTDFFMMEVPAESRFVKTGNGKIGRIDVHQGGKDFSFVRKE